MADRVALNEESLAAFLSGALDPEVLDRETRAATEHLDTFRTRVFIHDMSVPFVVTAAMAVRLCDATINHRLSAESLCILAFAIVGSDRFEWNDEVVAEVLHDWAAPEINYPLTPSNLQRFRRWLLREEPYPETPSPQSHKPRKVISELAKIPQR
jgi:hypothetical protein